MEGWKIPVKYKYTIFCLRRSAVILFLLPLFLNPPYRSLFLIVVVNNMMVEEGNKLQNWYDILIVVTKYSSDMKLLLFDYF